MPSGRLHLVRHGRPVVDPGTPSTRWVLDPRHLDDVRALRHRLPDDAVWAVSPETKARQTASLLTDGPVRVEDGLREQVRSGWVDDFGTVVDRAFSCPSVPAMDGWESLDACRTRVAATVAALRREHPGRDLALVGHGTAWTVLAAELAGSDPDPDVLRAMRFPDLTML